MEKYNERTSNTQIQLKSEQNKLRVLRLNSSLVAELDMRTASFTDSTVTTLTALEREKKNILHGRPDWNLVSS